MQEVAGVFFWGGGGNKGTVEFITINLFLNKIFMLQLGWPADSYASLGGPVFQ